MTGHRFGAVPTTNPTARAQIGQGSSIFRDIDEEVLDVRWPINFLNTGTVIWRAGLFHAVRLRAEP